ncbi:hypothetical protein Pmani_021332 [Petrolisthes manimaculis]|uniref:limulus clotting factor C n=1 Tax=Petrolisthes manimaculis TaxID=1843537 RepID=A0AAE1PEB9_9EUCA|nr:hypothetical protein Pmani_021332 [Petrolisthes manimaculis]
MWLCVGPVPLTALRRSALCHSLHGTCQRSGLSCRGRVIPSLCTDGRVCCTTERKRLSWPGLVKKLKRITPRDICHTNKQRKCERRGGRCQDSHSTNCNTVLVNKYCQGDSCTCCLGDHRRCTKKPECTERGGFCFKGKTRVCKSGKVERNWCTGKKCSCCIPASSEKCSCGKANSKRIVGGLTTTPPYKYPWLAGLSIPDVSDSYFCGGAIITNNAVITAAHCLINQFTGEPHKTSILLVGVGDHDQASTNDDIPGVTRKVKVAEIIIHKLYKSFEPHHDIGIIRLASRLDLSSHPQVRAVCLPSNQEDSQDTYEGETGVAYGWGVMNTSTLEQPDMVQEVALPIWDPTCDGKDISTVKVTKWMLCAGDKKGGKDTCLGDSGGPLTVAQEDDRHTLVGITSFGSGCGDPNSPGAYTRVSSYLDWILENTKNDQLCRD